MNNNHQANLFLIKKAGEEDVPGILALMKEAASQKDHPDWFVADDESYIRDHISTNGFIAVAKYKNDTAGFFMIKFPRSGEMHLGTFLDYQEQDLACSVIMDSAVVKKSFRGHSLQKKLLTFCEKELAGTPYRHYLCTVHPDNTYSLRNMQSMGYQVIKKTRCYGGLDRFVLVKDVPSELPV